MSPGKKLNFKRPFYWLIASAFLALAFLNLPGFSSKANKTETNPDPSVEPAAAYTPFATSGSTALYTLQGSGAGTANGDYVTASAGMDEVYRYFIEVPSGLSRLQIELFDADIGLGGSGEAAAGRDRSRAGGDPDYNTSATYSLIDPSGTSRTVRFTTGNSAGPASSDNAWLALYNGTGNNVADNFGTAAYTNNDGNNNWATNWTETSDDGSATTGAILITGGELRLGDNVAGTPSIEREADLSGSPGLNLGVAYLSFSFRTSSNLEDADVVTVRVSSNGGGAWTTLETFINDSTGTRQYDITSFIANNTRVQFVTNGLNSTEFFFVDNLQIHDGGAITAGHWELRIDQSSAVTTGDDINAIGIRAHDGTSGSGGTELNVYYDSHNGYGVNPPTSGTQSRSYDIYPYVTSGCSCSKNDFDYDSDSGNTGSMAFTSRLGAFTQNYSSSSLSTDNNWRSDTFSGWTNDTAATDYGIWRNALTISSYTGPSGNYTNFYLGNYQAVDPEVTAPTVNPTANSFRIYLPTDSATAPTKPYLEQFLTYLSGTNPPSTGQQTIFTVTVRMINQTGSAITFSASNLVTTNVPGSGATYGGSASVTQGSVVSQPSVGGTGNITWNPGTVSAGGFAILTYQVRVTPTSAGQRVAVTATPASGNGSRAQYVDETGNTTQTRSTFLFGPLCELVAEEGTLGPTAVDDVELTATAYSDGVHLEWKTGFEASNLGFNIYRDENGERTLINNQLVAGSALMAGNSTALTAGMQYSWWDALAGDKQNILYWIEDVDINGTVTTHGPFNLGREQGEAPAKTRSMILSALGANSSTQQQYGEQITEESEKPIKQKSSAKASRLQLSAQADLASARAVKLSIRDEGWYRVTVSDLIAAGLDSNLNPQYLQLFVGGQEQALLVSGAGETAAIEFYAAGQDNPYTNARTCWITVGNQPGRKINIINAPGDPSSPQSFPFTTEYKERSVYFSALRNGDQENFFGRVVSPSPLTQQIVLKNVDTTFTGTALLRVSLQGITEFAGPVDHKVLVKVNGVEAGRFTFDGRERAAGTFPIQQSLLREQTNDITLVSEAGGGDVSLVDYIRLTYQHKLRADNDSLRFTLGSKFQTEAVSSNPRLATVEDFTSPLIRVFDITNPAAPVEMAGKVSETGGRYSVTVEAIDSSTRTFLAITADKMKSPVSMQANQPSNLQGTFNQADLIIIAHSSLLPSVAPLKAMREGQKLVVAVVDVEDIYDEFNFGERSPKAIRDFLKTAKLSWKKAPRFVLLIGDATYDPKRYLGGGDFDLVPTKLVDATYLETASDDWFTDFNNDGVADIAIGRLPARTSDDASRFIAKLVEYEKPALPKANRKVLLVADRNDGFDFENATTQLRPLLPSGTTIQEVFRSKTTDPAMSAAITEAINNGVSVVNFAGHGSTGIWRGNVLTAQAAKALLNGKALPLVVSMTCLNGYFHDPVIESLAEALLNAEKGGAIAVWASSALTDPKQQAAVNQELYRQLFITKGQAATVGEAVMRAKTATGNSDVRQTWLLFGDPATRLK